MKHIKTRGFTIVELLIVIVVIGILAALVLNSFANAQQQARDTYRKHDLAQIKKSMLLQYNETGAWVRAGDTCSTNLTGFFNQSGTSATGSNYGASSMAECLKSSGYASEIMEDPSGVTSCADGTVCNIYMKFESGPAGDERRVCMYARLEKPDGTVWSDPCNSNYDTRFGMNYIVRVN